MSLRALLVVPIATAALMGAACSSDTPSGDGNGGIAATLEDFSIGLAQTSAPAGSVTFAITNEGPSVHEFEVLRTDTAADQLPVDSGVVQTSAEGIEIVDEVEEIAPGTDTELAVDLEPGTYAIICNVAGHYESGMSASFTAE